MGRGGEIFIVYPLRKYFSVPVVRGGVRGGGVAQGLLGAAADVRPGQPGALPLVTLSPRVEC